MIDFHFLRRLAEGMRLDRSPIDSGWEAEVVTLSCYEPPSSIYPPLLLASLGLIALATMMPAQVTSGEKNSPVADAPSRDDAAALQKKANEAQARIHAKQRRSRPA